MCHVWRFQSFKSKKTSDFVFFSFLMTLEWRFFGMQRSHCQSKRMSCLPFDQEETQVFGSLKVLATDAGFLGSGKLTCVCFGVSWSFESWFRSFFTVLGNLPISPFLHRKKKKKKNITNKSQRCDCLCWTSFFVEKYSINHNRKN